MSEEGLEVPETAPQYGEVQQKIVALELLVGGVLLVIVGWYTYEAFMLPAPYNPVDVGAGGFPLLLAGATLITLALYFIECIARHIKRDTPHMVRTQRPVSVLFGAVLFVLQALLFEHIGLLACVAIFTALTMFVAGERRVVHLIGVPIATSLSVYVVFVFLLGVYFP